MIVSTLPRLRSGDVRNVEGYLIQAGRNQRIDQIRRGRSTPRRAVLTPDQLEAEGAVALAVDGPDPAQALADQDAVAEVLSRLPDHDQHLLRMAATGATALEIAGSFGRSESWVKTRLHRARASVRGVLVALRDDGRLSMIGSAALVRPAVPVARATRRALLGAGAASATGCALLFSLSTLSPREHRAGPQPQQSPPAAHAVLDDDARRVQMKAPCCIATPAVTERGRTRTGEPERARAEEPRPQSVVVVTVPTPIGPNETRVREKRPDDHVACIEEYLILPRLCVG